MNTNVKRKLAAVLAADAVGFSRLMGSNEEQTLRVLAAHRAVIDGVIKYHEGRIVGTAGDSVLAEFASSVVAVRCAVEIQEALKTRNGSLPESKQLHFRIGINLGDVMIQGEDLLGDGVNVAARLEGIAEPGGICISSSVYDQISGKLDLGFESIGEQSLKNIDRPIRVYRVTHGSLSAPLTHRSRRRWIYVGGAAAAVAATAGIAVYLQVGEWSFTKLIVSPKPIAATRTSPASATVSAPTTNEPTQKTTTAPPNESAERTTIAPTHAPMAKISTTPAKEPKTKVAQASEKRSVDNHAKDLDAARERAQAELARARAEADIARIRAQTERLRRQAAAETSARKDENDVVSSPAPSMVIPERALETADTSGSTNRFNASAAPSGAPWTAEISCGPFEELPPYSGLLSVSMKGSEYILERFKPGQIGHLLLKGAPTATGDLRLTGYVIARAASVHGKPSKAIFEGALEGQRYSMQGRTGRRECTLTFSSNRP